MRGRSTIQSAVATGRFTLPVAIVLCSLLWIFQAESLNESATWIIHVLTSYLIIELNTSYSLIRTRTSFHITLYVLFVTVSLFLHPFRYAWISLPLFLLSIHQLFSSYEAEDRVTPLFHSFLFLSIASYLVPQFLFFIPLAWLGLLMFNSFSPRGFVASLLGILTPYWFVLGYSFLKEDFALINSPFQAVSTLSPLQYSSNFQLEPLFLMGAVVLLTLVCGVYYLGHSYLEKSRTRSFFSFLLICQLGIYLLMLLFPQQIGIFFALSLPFSAILGGHFFTLTNNRFSNLFFIAIFVTLILVTAYYLWMH
ncbi:MAG: hypothetical protein ACRC3Z_07825 [Phocaeicola sp.]